MDRPRGLTEDVRADWAVLARPTETPEPFDPASVGALPEPARRWLLHAIAPGIPLQTTVELRMHGQIRLGAWRSFTAIQHLTPGGGFVWAATARLLGLPVVGFDRYTRDTGQMRWRLLDVVPVMAAGGSDVTRSAAGRHAGELLLAAPAAALIPQVRWQDVDDRRVTAHVHVGPGSHAVTLTVAPDGALTELVMTRWATRAGSRSPSSSSAPPWTGRPPSAASPSLGRSPRGGTTAPTAGRTDSSSGTRSRRRATAERRDPAAGAPARPTRRGTPQVGARMVSTVSTRGGW